jgi:hypothetical protein
MGQTPCSVCAYALHMDTVSPFKLFDFLEEAVAVLESVRQMRRVGVIYLAELYRGVLKKSRNKVFSDCKKIDSLLYF